MTSNQLYPIEIRIKTNYLEAQSKPSKNYYVFTYTITIKNTGSVPSRLLSRHWYVTDANGKVQEVIGDGVVGKQPYLRAGESFQYTSGTTLETPLGSMHGSYQMITDDGQEFEAMIPAFSLSKPDTVIH